MEPERVLAYSYSEPLLESLPNGGAWGRSVDQVYQDFGDRLQLQQLLQDCRSHPGTYVLVRQLADLGNSVAEVRDRLSEMEALEVHLIVLEESISSKGKNFEENGSENVLRRSDLLTLLQMMQNTQVMQASQLSRILRRGHARNRIKALPPPGKAPYGYRRGKDRYVLDRSTAPIVKDFFEQFLLYGSLRGSVRYLQKKYSKKISVSTGKRWLASAVYRGDLAYHNGEVISNTHTPILSRDEAAQIDRLMRRNRRMPPRSASAPRSLSGLVVCGNCQSPMTVSRVTSPRQKQEYLYLRPTACLGLQGCSKMTGLPTPIAPDPIEPDPIAPNLIESNKCKAIAYAKVLDCTIQQICHDLPLAVAGMPVPDMEGIKQEIAAKLAAKQAILAQLPDLTASGVLDSETADLRAYRLRTEMAALQAQLAQLPPVSLKAIAQAVSIPQFWLDLSEPERRFYFREFIRQIQILRQGSAWQVKLMFIF
ncbi:MAG: recombinase family protein [Oscillatoriophycideae cyanobacterium NC_groundwater_1537_Pr4_S-0.65um_50_18]|nr:recombinase family protein [Oscillatoriophycideae cyanobacterium NC_groundwater_1537_Pr4_S-0.65um_50_18]